MAKSEGQNHTNSTTLTAGASPRPMKEITAPLAHKRSRKAVILFTKEEHRGSDQILSGVVGKVVQEQPNAAVKPATEIGIAENRIRNGKERGADGH